MSFINIYQFITWTIETMKWNTPFASLRQKYSAKGHNLKMNIFKLYVLDNILENKIYAKLIN